MPIYNGYGKGDLFVEYNVVLPMDVSAQSRKSKLHLLHRVADD